LVYRLRQKSDPEFPPYVGTTSFLKKSDFFGLWAPSKIRSRVPSLRRDDKLFEKIGFFGLWAPLHNQSGQDYYCYLINITPDGSIYAIYPDPEERMEYARVKAGEKRELIDEVIIILKNVGEQTLKLIATRSPIDVSLLQKEGFARRKQEKLNPLERLLVSAAHGQRGLLRIKNQEWVTGQVMFEVK
jgi:hypothetical protein